MAVELRDWEYQALAEFRFALRCFRSFSERKAGECGLTPQQHQALLVIRGATRDRVGVGYIAERLLLRPHSASELVSRLEALGMVEREAWSEDRRRSVLRLTARAREVLASLSATHRDEIVRIRPTLTSVLERFPDGDG